jgi:hypothetical protein
VVEGHCRDVVMWNYGAYEGLQCLHRHSPYSVREMKNKFDKVTDLETSCNKVVVKPISGCVRTACSQLL